MSFKNYEHLADYILLVTSLTSPSGDEWNAKVIVDLLIFFVMSLID